MIMDEDHIVLAAEWVLGTLDAEELKKAEALIASEPEFAAMVHEWERKLGELNAMVAPIEPPADLFDKIKVQLAGVTQDGVIHLPDPGNARQSAELGAMSRAIEALPQAIDALPRAGEVAALRPNRPADNGAQPQNDQRARVVLLTRRVRRWQEVGATLATLAAAIAVVFVTSIARPDLMPDRLRPRPKVVEVIKTVEAPPSKQAEPNRFTAVLQRDAASPAFILTVDLADRTMTVRRVTADNPVGKSYELWLVSDKFPGPRSLGLVQAGDFTQPAKLASYEPETIRDATFAISLEPEGGSPTGTTTGPVLWTGKLIETVPPK
jgi:anti-sigma-K factor RskA